MTIHEPVDSDLAQLRSELEAIQAPEALEAALAASFRRRHRPRRPSLWWMPPLALAATLAMLSWIVRTPLPPLPQGLPAAESDPGPFLALRPLERIALEPGATVVESQFPRALLADWGLPVSPDRANQPVRAEMLYSPEGEVLAVRLID